jgi:hypothetical protein
MVNQENQKAMQAISGIVKAETLIITCPFLVPLKLNQVEIRSEVSAL